MLSDWPLLWSPIPMNLPRKTFNFSYFLTLQDEVKEEEDLKKDDRKECLIDDDSVEINTPERSSR